MDLIKQEFFNRDTLIVAEELIGVELVVGEKRAIINETEAYIGQGDPACHAARGKTKRNEVMFGPPGGIYVYLIYGMYFCLNFVTEKEAGELCLLSGVLGNNREIFFPKLSQDLSLISFDQIAIKYLHQLDYEPAICKSEDEARRSVQTLSKERKWPCYFFKSDTTGEKDFEEFFTEDEIIDLDRFQNIGIIKSKLKFDGKKLNHFLEGIERIKSKQNWGKQEIVILFNKMIPNFKHLETNKYLDEKM